MYKTLIVDDFDAVKSILEKEGAYSHVVGVFDYSSNPVKPDNLLRLFRQHPWLENYVRPGGVEEYFNKPTGELLNQLAKLMALIEEFDFPDAQVQVKDVCSHILGHPEADLKLSTVAELLTINHTYLSSLFKRETGIGYGEYVTAVRMRRAEYLLLNTDFRIYEISNKLGYSDTDYFSRLFKIHSGQSPSKYR